MSDRVITTADGVRLHTRTDGDPSSPVLLLANSLGTDLSLWDGQVALWAGTHFVLRYDQRGHGTSDTPPPPYTIEQFGGDALAVLDAYAVGRADLCGVSLGGLVVLWLVANAPQRVRRAVLADTAARIGTQDSWRARAATVRAESMGAVTELVLSRFFSPGFRASGGPAVARVARMLRTAAVDGYAGGCDALAAADLRALAPRAGVPCLVVVGTADEATPPSDAAALASLLPDARYVELPGAGHLSNLEQPQRFGALVHDFLVSSEQESARA